MRRLPALLVTALVAVAGCSSSDGSTAPPSTTTTTTASTTTATAAGCAADVAAGRTEETLTSGGVERTYLRYVPPEDAGRARTLVLDLTAYSPASLEERISGFTLPDAAGNVQADLVDAVVVTPDPVGGAGELLTWNLTDQPGWADDDLFLDDLVAQVVEDTCAAADQILVMGFAIGGVMATRFACRNADEVALLVAVSGLDDPPGCSPSRPVPVLAFHGTGDRFLPYDGGVGAGAGDLPLSPETTAGLVDVIARRGPVPETAQAWADRNGCAVRPAPSPAGQPVTMASWSGCDGADVVLVTIDGGEHTWPGSTTMDDLEPLLGPVSDAVEANVLIRERYEAVTAD